jgi:hypothetical protein
MTLQATVLSGNGEEGFRWVNQQWTIHVFLASRQYNWFELNNPLNLDNKMPQLGRDNSCV